MPPRKLLGTNIFDQIDLLLAHGWHNTHHEVFPFIETILDLYISKNKRYQKLSSIVDINLCTPNM